MTVLDDNTRACSEKGISEEGVPSTIYKLDV
jgi:hypothetical protein